MDEKHISSEPRWAAGFSEGTSLGLYSMSNFAAQGTEDSIHGTAPVSLKYGQQSPSRMCTYRPRSCTPQAHRMEAKPPFVFGTSRGLMQAVVTHGICHYPGVLCT